MVFKSVGKAAAAPPAIGPRSLSGDDRYAQIIIPPIERNLKRHSRQQRQKTAKEGQEERETQSFPNSSFISASLPAPGLSHSGGAAAVRPTGTSNAVALLPPSTLRPAIRLIYPWYVSRILSPPVVVVWDKV